MATACTVALVVATLGWTCVLAPALLDLPGPARWWIPGDVWVFVNAAHFVAAGALPYVYEADPAYVYPPGIAVVLAPVAALGWAFELSESTGVVVHKPTLWLLLAPVGVGLSFVPLSASRQLFWVVGSSSRPWLVQVAIAAVVLPPAAIIYGHFEELAVLGFLLLSTRFALQDRHDAGAWCLAAALLFKQTALLAAPLLLLHVPPGRRAGAAARACAPVAVLTSICLVADWADTSSALLRATSFPETGRAALWLTDGRPTQAATAVRIVGVLAALVLTAAIRRRRDAAGLLSGLSLVLLLRVLFEPVVFSYYLTTPAAFAIAAALARRTRPLRELLATASVLLLFVPDLTDGWWWLVFTCGVVVLAAGATRELVRPTTNPGLTALEELGDGFDSDPVAGAAEAGDRRRRDGRHD